MDEPNRVRNPYYSVAAWCAGVSIVLLVVAGGLIVPLVYERFQGSTREAVIAAAFFVGLFGFAILGSSFFFLLLARTVQRFIDNIRNDRCLAHWRYTPAEWQAFQSAESPLLRRDFFRSLLLPLLLGAPIGLALVAFAQWTDGQTGEFWMVALVTAGFLLFMLGMAYYIRVVRRRSWGRKCLLDPPDSYLHLEFARANGEFLYFRSFGQRLIGAQLLESEPAVVELTILSSSPRGGSIEEVRRILVPSAARETAAAIVAKLQAVWRLT
ncbi:MAG: hypothetical protein U0746_05115 [Gemmataceae bacterium]